VIGPDLFSFAELWRHYRTCRRNKRNTRNALAFEFDVEANLMQLAEDLQSHRYRPGRSLGFVTEGPKPREVFAAEFRDRVVHHLLVWHQERVFEPRFIRDSYACRRGKGTLAASDRAIGFLRQATANGRRRAYSLHLDVASFFPSIHKQTLFALLVRAVPHPELRWLAQVLLFHDPTQNYVFKPGPWRVPAPGTPGHPVPARKSLFGKGNERGVPIGNLTSQFWGNVYLNELDQYVKRVLRVHHYLRYVDDLLLASTDPEELLAWRDSIAAFLAEKLQLSLRAQEARPRDAREGVDFVGWRIWWNGRAVRRGTAQRFEARLDAHGRELSVPPHGPARIALPEAIASGAVLRLRQTLASYSGHLRRGGARAWVRAWSARPWIGALFQRHGWRVAPRWPARELDPSARAWTRYRALSRGAGEHGLVFRRVGCFIEFQGPQRILAARALRLRSVRLQRGAYALTAGFPASRASAFRQRALAADLFVLEMQPRSRSPKKTNLMLWSRGQCSLHGSEALQSRAASDDRGRSAKRGISPAPA
jgi:retron-type reverse transcriptase